MLKPYLEIAKPGIIAGNTLTAAGGFILASNSHFNIFLFISTLIGLALIIGSGCAFNNYIDREIDKKMERTKDRALAKEVLTTTQVISFGTFIGLLGVLILQVFTNTLTTVLASFGFFAYVFVYSFSKYLSIHGTLIGSISGAIPPVVGYCAIRNRIDTGAVLLFCIVALWQMPHFYAIAIYRIDEYRKASIPVLPIVKGINTTKIHILIYTLLFCLAAPLLSLARYTGTTYTIVMAIASTYWLILCIQGFTVRDNIAWAKSMFRFSLIIILAFSALISFDKII